MSYVSAGAVRDGQVERGCIKFHFRVIFLSILSSIPFKSFFKLQILIMYLTDSANQFQLTLLI